MTTDDFGFFSFIWGILKEIAAFFVVVIGWLTRRMHIRIDKAEKDLSRLNEKVSDNNTTFSHKYQTKEDARDDRHRMEEELKLLRLEANETAKRVHDRIDEGNKMTANNFKEMLLLLQRK